MGPKHLDLNQTQVAKDGESFSSMKNLPESLENTIYPTQDDILKKDLSEEEKCNKCQENMKSIQDSQQMSQCLINLQVDEDKLQSEQIQIDFNQKDIDKLFPEYAEGIGVHEIDEIQKENRSKSSIYSSPCQFQLRKKHSSSELKQLKSNISQVQINSYKNKDKRSRLSTLNVVTCPTNFQQIQPSQDLCMCKKGASSEKSFYARQQQQQQCKKRVFNQVQNSIINFKKSWVQILYYVGKMKRIMCQTTLFFRPHLLSQWQLKAINDVSSDFTKEQQQQLQTKKRHFSRIIHKSKNLHLTKKLIRGLYQKINIFGILMNKLSNAFYKYLSKLPLFNPMNFSYKIWEMIIFLCSTINFIYIPIELCIDGLTMEFYFLFKHFSFIVFAIDIFVRANTLSSEEGSDRDIHQNILTKYIQSRFIFDLISLFSLYYFFLPSQYFLLFFFVRIFYQTRILNSIQEHFLLRIHTTGIIQFSMLLIQALYFCHIFSCGFLKLGLFQVDQGKGWIIHYQLQNEDRWTQYLYSYYFSVITMTTIGYGDITAQSQIEKFFMIFFTIVSCGIFGYTINSIGNILYDFNQKRQKFLQQLAQLNKYFKFFNVDIVLQSKARKYLEYVNSEKFSDSSITSDSLSSLSNYLQTEIKINSYKKVINRFQMFSKHFSEQFRDCLVVKMKELVLSPEQFLFESGCQMEPAIYFINCGSIEVVNEKENITKKLINTLKNGDIFGIEEFFGEVYQKPFSYKSNGVSSLLYISHSDFQQVLKKFPDQVEIYCFIRDSILFNSDYSKVSKACYSCKQYTHPLNKCPYLFYGTNSYKIIQKYNREIDHIIENFERKSFGKTNSLVVKDYVKSKAVEFLICNYDQSFCSILSKDFGSDAEGQDDTFIMNKSQNVKITNITPQTIISEDINEFSQPNSSIHKQPSQQQIIPNQTIYNLYSMKDQYKNTKMISADLQKMELEATLSPITQNSYQYLSTKEQNDRFLYLSNTQNLIKTIDLDVDSNRKQLKPSSAIYIDQPQDDQSLNNQSQKPESIKIRNQNTSPNFFLQSQPSNNLTSNLNVFKIPLTKCNGNIKQSQKDKLNSYEQVPINTSITSLRKQFIKVESAYDQGNQNIFYQMQNQNFCELKELILHMFMYIQHQEMYGSTKKIDIKKKILESNQPTNWNIKILTLGDIDLDIMQNYKIYFPQSNADKIIQKMKIKSATHHLKNRIISQLHSPSSPTLLKLQMKLDHH